jgi:hypothetical protein
VEKLPWMAHLAGAKAPVFFYEKFRENFCDGKYRRFRLTG